jgi:hypothetical protein
VTIVPLAAAGYDRPRMPVGVLCLVHAHRAWVPIEQHHVWPLGMGGPDEPGNRISVCPNGHYMIHEFIRQLIIHSGGVPHDVSRHFGAKVRRYALRGWTEAGKPSAAQARHEGDRG